MASNYLYKPGPEPPKPTGGKGNNQYTAAPTSSPYLGDDYDPRYKRKRTDDPLYNDFRNLVYRKLGIMVDDIYETNDDFMMDYDRNWVDVDHEMRTRYLQRVNGKAVLFVPENLSELKEKGRILPDLTEPYRSKLLSYEELEAMPDQYDGGFTEVPFMDTKPYTVHHRAFAPWERFGDMFGNFQESFRGDRRAFSLDDHTNRTPGDGAVASSRLYGYADVYPQAGIATDSEGTPIREQQSSRTIGHWNFIGWETEATTPSRFGPEVANYDVNQKLLQMRIEGRDVLITDSPDIDFKLTVRFQQLTMDGQLYLRVFGHLQGKGFPAYEAFIEDNTGNRVFLSTFAVDSRLDLGGELIFNFYDMSQPIDLLIPVEHDGTFKTGSGVEMKNRTGAAEWDAMGIFNWNQTHFSKPPAQDCGEPDCGGVR